MAEAVKVWWLALVAVAVVNAVAWGVSARVLERRIAGFPPALQRSRRVLLWLAAGYVAGCAFRSVLPMVDVPRICLYASPVSYIAVGRTVATLAELCLAAQFALLLREAGSAARMPAVMASAAAIVPLIALAEVFSWSAVLTTNNLLHAFENSLWAITALLVMAGFAAARGRLVRRSRRLIDAVLVAGAVYVAYMAWADVPMYVARWRADVAAGEPTLSLAAGLAEVLRPCVPAGDWAAWRDDVTWLTLYFSLAVWISIALPHCPPFAAAGTTSSGKGPRPSDPAGVAPALEPRS